MISIEEVKPDYETQIFKKYKEPGKDYKVFSTTGESMNAGKLGDSKAGNDLLGQLLNPEQYEQELLPNRLGYVITTETNSYHKDITGYDKISKTIQMKSRNPQADLKELSIPLNDQVLIYRVTHAMG